MPDRGRWHNQTHVRKTEAPREVPEWIRGHFGPLRSWPKPWPKHSINHSETQKPTNHKHELKSHPTQGGIEVRGLIRFLKAGEPLRVPCECVCFELRGYAN